MEETTYEHPRVRKAESSKTKNAAINEKYRTYKSWQYAGVEKGLCTL